MSGNLRVGVIGMGVGLRHAEAYGNDPRCEVTMLCDSSEPALEKAGCIFPDAMKVREADKIIADPSIDIVSIASFDEYHFSQTRDALNAGKHVFVEKPICRSEEELVQLRSAWMKHAGRLKLGCNFVLRGAPLYQWLKEKISTGAFGRIYSIDAEYLYGRLHKIVEGWRSETREYSVMQGGGIHMMDLLLWLTGERPVDVVAAGNRICTENTAFRYNDFATSIMTYSSGMITRLTANFGCVHRHQHVLRIYGTKATFIYDDCGARLHTSRDPETDPEFVGLDALPPDKGVLIPRFISAVDKDEDITSDFAMICDGLRVCLACDRAAETNQKERIKYK